MSILNLCSIGGLAGSFLTQNIKVAPGFCPPFGAVLFDSGPCTICRIIAQEIPKKLVVLEGSSSRYDKKYREAGKFSEISDSNLWVPKSLRIS